jgi:predicted negative regulator of RcsB-dependent stress response
MSKNKSAENKMKGDDRNIVAVDEEYAAPGIEDRIYEFWEKNKNLILFLIVAIILLIVGREGIRAFTKSREQSIQNTYAEITTSEGRRSFANEHKGHPLGGFALLVLADESYQEGEFTKAAVDYEKALKRVEEPILVARAKLGQAMALIQSGVDSKGVSLLEGLARDEDLGVDAVRCEAYYHLASLSQEKGDNELARSYLNAIVELVPTGIWASRATSVLNFLPPSGESEE